VGGSRETIGPGGAAKAGGVVRAGFVSAGRTFVAALRASLPLVRADSVFGSTGTSGTRGFLSAATRGCSGVAIAIGGATVGAGGALVTARGALVTAARAAIPVRDGAPAS